MKNILIAISLSIFAIACSEDGVSPSLSNLEGQGNLIGIWEYESYEQISDTTYAQVYRKVNRIAGDQPGITFKQNGAFISKQNSGWCGTPPISYDSFDGTFSVASKNLLNINSTYWGGKMNYKAEVLELNNRRLKIRPFAYEYEERGF
ncbi:MAG: hypothetical protein QMB03_03345 [Spirosomataceae bacterium]